jgi:hypothetical protein
MERKSSTGVVQNALRKKKRYPSIFDDTVLSYSHLVPEAGFEPAQRFRRGILS